MASAKIGVIGGSGLYQIEGLTDIEEVEIDTPFGKPSDSIIVGQLEGQSVAFLPRHGRGHRISPTDLPNRANIYALKSLGVEWVISVSAVGSMKEEIEPLDIVVPDQLFDRTTKRVSTFFGDNEGIVAHIGFAEPFCPDLRGLLLEEARQVGVREVHDGGVYICMEGPQFSTKGESNIYRSWGVSVIGMTAIPEAKLAREAEMRYATLAMATDYDCWYEGHDSVTVEMVVNNLQQNVGRAKEVVRRVVKRLATYEPHNFDAVNALATAVMTDPAKIPAATKEKYKLLIGKYFKD